MKLLEILKKMLSCATTETSESTEVSKSTVLPLVDSNKESKDYADLEDIRLVVGDKTLALVYNVRLGGLHNVLSYDPCSGATQDCYSEIKVIIEKNLEEAYESIVVKTGEDQYLLNIGVKLLLGNGSLSQQLCGDVINVFYPIIKRFIDEHVVNNKVGVYSVFTGGYGTSVGLLSLVNLLEKDGYICCGVGTSYDSHSYPLKRAKGWHGFTYIALEELIKDTEKLPKIKILSLLHDRLIEKMQQANRQNDDNSRENTEETDLFLQKLYKDVDSVYKPFSGEYWYLWYKGQCQTFADVIAALNNKYHYSNITELIHDFNAVINEYTERGTVDVDAVAVFENILSNDIFVKKLFNKGSLNLNIFIIRKTKRFAIPERAVYFLKTKRTAGVLPHHKNFRPAYAGIHIMQERSPDTIRTPFYSFCRFAPAFRASRYAASTIALYAATLCALTILPRKARREPTYVLAYDAS